MTHGVPHCIPCSPRTSVVDSNDPRRMIYHPLISPLKTISAVSGADEPHLVGPFHDPAKPRLPLPVPTALKPVIGAGADEPDRCTLVPESQHNLCYPKIDPSCHPRYECLKSVSNRCADFFFRPSTTLASGIPSFSGLWRVKQHRCCRSSDSVILPSSFDG